MLGGGAISGHHSGLYWGQIRLSFPRRPGPPTSWARTCGPCGGCWTTIRSAGPARPQPNARWEPGPRRAQARVWQAQRQARLAKLGFTDLASYLQTRMIQEGWSIRRMRAELRVSRSWLVEQLLQLGLRREPDEHQG